MDGAAACRIQASQQIFSNRAESLWISLPRLQLVLLTVAIQRHIFLTLRLLDWLDEQRLQSPLIHTVVVQMKDQGSAHRGITWQRHHLVIQVGHLGDGYGALPQQRRRRQRQPGRVYARFSSRSPLRVHQQQRRMPRRWWV